MKREHLSLNTVLHVLNQLVLDLESGRLRPDDVDYELFEKIMSYIEEFLDTMHHPKEDKYLFPALLKKTSEVNDVIMQLEEQHRQGTEHRQKLEVHFQAMKDKHPGQVEKVIDALKDYLQAHREHMKLEDNVIMPLAEKVLTEEDWAPIDAAFNENEDPVFGDVPKSKFRKLLSDITFLAPAPIGLGGGRR
ncbi:hemerythrin domain-containing protein [Terasakiella sp. A23]|uniref:hemerythrin domain-containing protein n=1 Tax=Terasakiella sp. FCG-A23 TaxID=3080561 RepID=UPI0029553A78|nr:hemerythrin domain-containing protein [Terasakiella sp. A23]